MMKALCGFLLMAILYSADAVACSCQAPPESKLDFLQQQLGNVSAVVLAEVVSISSIPADLQRSDDGSGGFSGARHNREVTHFSRIQSWQGEVPEYFTTNIITDCCLCGMRFERGERYLLFLHKNPDQDYYHTSICAGNQKGDRAAPYIQRLNTLLPEASRHDQQKAADKNKPKAEHLR